ncbi:hypothetical protein CMI37_30395 [Candidatus Pacearchaeota archaeon]|nr:hypothetical protein [Candidatus Pacearchaeota archaeon]|tara:strand:- start:9 stop:401 length:393 start_codon:yes stop_codon:yes gene_type:complete
MTDALDFAKQLRKLADLYEQNPTFPVPIDAVLNVPVDAHTLREVAKAAPSFKKNVVNDYFVLRYDYAPLQLDFYTNRKEVCTARVVGTKLVTRQIAVETREETHEEDVLEWDCPPLLQGGKHNHDNDLVG